jgi:hypothetical protein
MIADWPVLVRRKAVMALGFTRYDLRALEEAGRLHPVRLTGKRRKYLGKEIASLVGETKEEHE